VRRPSLKSSAPSHPNQDGDNFAQGERRAQLPIATFFLPVRISAHSMKIDIIAQGDVALVTLLSMQNASKPML
jgi:hypothetical protein